MPKSTSSKASKSPKVTETPDDDVKIAQRTTDVGTSGGDQKSAITINTIDSIDSCFGDNETFKEVIGQFMDIDGLEAYVASCVSSAKARIPKIDANSMDSIMAVIDAKTSAAAELKSNYTLLVSKRDMMESIMKMIMEPLSKQISEMNSAVTTIQDTSTESEMARKMLKSYKLVHDDDAGRDHSVPENKREWGDDFSDTSDESSTNAPGSAWNIVRSRKIGKDHAPATSSSNPTGDVCSTQMHSPAAPTPRASPIRLVEFDWMGVIGMVFPTGQPSQIGQITRSSNGWLLNFGGTINFVPDIQFDAYASNTDANECKYNKSSWSTSGANGTHNIAKCIHYHPGRTRVHMNASRLAWIIDNLRAPSGRLEKIAREWLSDDCREIVRDGQALALNLLATCATIQRLESDPKLSLHEPMIDRFSPNSTIRATSHWKSIDSGRGSRDRNNRDRGSRSQRY